MLIEHKIVAVNESSDNIEDNGVLYGIQMWQKVRGRCVCAYNVRKLHGCKNNKKFMF